MSAMLAQTSGTWQAQDIGTVAAAGHSSVSGNTYTVSGSGADIWGANDAFHFYAQTLTGDGYIMFKIEGMTDTNGWAKAGIMIRETLAANSPNVFLAATPEWHGIVAQQRSTAGGETTVVQGPAASVPHWIRLTRAGNQITAATLEGNDWVTLRAFTAPMSPTVYAGLAVCSHNNGSLCTATFLAGGVFANTSPPPSPPPTPTNLTATTLSSSQISLSWTGSTNASTYQVERSTDGVNFAQIATAPGSYPYSYSDGGRASSTTYYYRVRAVNSAGTSGYSNIASATTNAPPPPPSGSWQSIDIGTGTAGQTTASGDTVTLTGSGRDIWNTADGLRYYYQPTPGGDCEIFVRVASLTKTDGWAKAGIMLRESLEPGSPHAWVCVSAEHGTAFQWRATASGETQSAAPSEDGGPPRWLKLVFKAERDYGGGGPARRVESYVSRDGATWTGAGAQFMSNTWRYIGLAVTSHNEGALCTAQFDSFRYLPAPPVPTNVHVTHRGPNGELVLAWDYPVSDVDRYEFTVSPQTTDHEWRLAGIASPGGTRVGTAYVGVGRDYALRVGVFRDLVESPLMSMIWVKSTVTPELAVVTTTSSSITLRIHEPTYGFGGTQGGPWAIERSSDGNTFTPLASNLQSSGPDTDYVDGGMSPNTTRYYRARQQLTNGDISAYSQVVTATTPPAGTNVPAAPSALAATAISSTQISLSWTDNATDETSYEVQRSTNGTTFAAISGNLAPNTTSLSDGALSPSTIYYYRVRASNAAGASAFSNVAQATTPASNAPPPDNSWQAGDVGVVGVAGSDSTSGTTVTLRGSGADVWGTADSFRFRYQALAGDGSISARVVSMTDTDGWAKAGVMIRSSLLADASNVFAAVTPEWHGIVAQSRGASGGMTNVAAGPAATAPYWLRLTRAGTTFTAQASVDGATWATYATFTVSMVQNVVIGLAVTSHNQNALCTATFDHVTISGGAAPPPPPPPPPPSGTWSAADIGAVGIAGSYTASGSTISISGSGADIWDAADAFRFVWQTRTGDGVVEAQVASMGNTNGWAKAGVMIRESANANAPNVFVAVTPEWHGIVAQARATAGGATTISGSLAANAPYWVRIARTGNTFTAATSPDGVTWTTLATVNVTMSATANFGFAVTAHDNAQLNQAVFQDPYVGAP